jgi:hypothetical protein
MARGYLDAYRDALAARALATSPSPPGAPSPAPLIATSEEPCA